MVFGNKFKIVDALKRLFLNFFLLVENILHGKPRKNDFRESYFIVIQKRIIIKNFERIHLILPIAERDIIIYKLF